MEVTEIGRIGQWAVLVKPWPNYDDNATWWDVRVKHDDAKGSYWLAWNGERFARNKSLESIAKNPGLADRVSQALKNWRKA
jgi:hypothetical protein